MKTQTTTLDPRSGRTLIACYLGFLTAMIAAGAYFVMLTGFSLYDDEGTLMLTVKQYLGGRRIYEDIYTIYGPVYYFYQAALRTLTGTPVTHDTTRISSLIPWLGVALLSCWITLRLTKSLVVAALALTVVSLGTWFFRVEPGHPQELTMLLLFAFAACPLVLPAGKRNGIVPFAMGALAAALLLIKINMGVFVLAALALVLLAYIATDRLARGLGIAIGAGCILLPAVLMRSHLDADWAREYCAVETAGIAAAVLCLFYLPRHSTRTWRDIFAAASGCGITIIAMLAILAMQGVSMYAVLDSLLFEPWRIFAHNRSWYSAPYTSPAWFLLAALGLGTAIFFVIRRPLPGSADWQRFWQMKTCLTVAAVAALLLRQDPMSYVTPFAWLMLFHPAQKDWEEQSFPRAVLCIVTIIQTLYAYPVMGSHGLFIRCLLYLLVLVCAKDCLDWFTERRALPDWYARRGRLISVAGLAAIAVLNLGILAMRYRNYQALPALDLPGASLVHVDADVKNQLEPLVKSIRESCDAFESLPGLPSLSFWTGEYPLTGLADDGWTLVFSEQQQAAIIAALSQHPRACVVYHPGLTAFWNPGGSDLDVLPLVHYIRQEFKPAMASGKYQLLIHKERSWSSLEQGSQ